MARVVLIVAVAAITSGGAAVADDAVRTGDATLTSANALFAEARALADAGRYPEACDKLVASLALRRRLGVQLNLADCYERVGKTAAAWRLFRDAATLAHDLGDPREDPARERLAALAARLSRLVVVVPPGARAGLEIERDAEPVRPADYGRPQPVDPGSHTVTVSQPGRLPWSIRVTVAAKEEVAIRVPELRLATADVASTAPRDPTRATWIAAGVGAASLGVGAGFGIAAWSRARDARPACDRSGRCTDQGYADASRSRRDGTIASVAFAVSGAALVTAAVLYARSPRSGARVAPLASTTTAGLALEGRF